MTIEDIDATIQEIKVKDITLSGVVSQEELSVNVDSNRVNVMDVDVNVVVDGISSSLVESQIVTYERIKDITDLSPEVTYEKGFAASARSAKEVHDLYTELSLKHDILAGNVEKLEEAVENLENNPVYPDNPDTPVVGDSYWKLVDGKLYSDYDIHVRGNAVIEGDTSSGGEAGGGGGGEGGASSLSQLNDVTISSPNAGDVLLYDSVSGMWYNTSQENIRPDLDNYATRDWVNSSFVQNGALDDYAKEEDLNTLASLLSSMWTLSEDKTTVIATKPVTIKNNLIVEGDTSSGGAGQDTPSAGLDEKAILDLLEREKYVTEGYVSDIITELNLSQYAKGSDLDALQAEVDNIDAVLGLSETAAGYINTWNEVVAFLDGYKNSEDLAAILSDMNNEIAKKVAQLDFDELVEEVEDNKNSITALDTRLKAEEDVTTTYKDWWSALKGKIAVENGNVKISTNLIVTGDTSSGGSGQDTPASGTVTGINVNGTPYEPNTQGVIDLSSAFNSIDVSGQLADYAKKSVVDSQFASVNSALAGKQNLITSNNKLPYSLVSDTPTIPTKTSQISEDTNLYFTNDRAVNALSDTLKGYLKLSGGTMSGDIAMSVNTFLRDEVGNAMIGYNGTLVRVGNTARATDIKGSSVTINGYTPITNGNIANQSVASAKSLITSNGLTFADFTSSTVNIGAGTYSNYQTHIYGNAIRLRYGNNGEIGLILNSSGNITVGNTDAASTDYRFYVYGNMRVREQALVGSLKIGTPNDNYFATLKMDGSSLSIDKELILLAGGTSDICPSIAASFKAKIAQIQNLITNNVIIGASSGTASNLAFNVQKYTSVSSQAPAGLTNLFSIGTDGKATFNGDVVVNGNLIVSGDTSSGGSGQDTPASGTVTGIKVNGIAYEPTNGIVTLPNYPSSFAWSSISGKPTTLAGYGITDGLTASALAGYMPTTGGTFSGEITAFNLAISNTGTGYHLQFKRGGGNIIWCPSGGYYRIVCNGAGTSDGDATLLIKSGNVSVKGNLSASGTVTNGSDIRFKDIIDNKVIRIEDIANAPLFTFKWNDREDDIIHMGSSAQYWENIVPELVIGEDFKTMDYSTLGVGIGISLAKKAVNHEERIKALEKENKALKEEIRRMQYGS